MRHPLLVVFAQRVDQWCEWLQHSRGRSTATVSKYRGHLERYAGWVIEPPPDPRLAPESTTEPLHPTPRDLERYAGIVAHTMKLTPRARRPLVSALRGFFLWLKSAGGATDNPAEALPQPKAGKPLPRAMQLDQAERLLLQPDITTFNGVRDACILALFMGCGFRLRGLVALNESALLWTQDDSGREVLVIRVVEKGDRERLQPVPDEAAMLVRAYLGTGDLASIPRTLPSGDRVLFVSTRNRTVPAADYHGDRRRLSPSYVQQMMKAYCDRAGIPRDVAHPHALRHMLGAEMMESDVDLRSAQELLGHADIQSTTIYTRLAHRRLRRDIDAANPLGKMRGPLLDSLRSLNRAVTPPKRMHASPPAAQKTKSPNPDTA